MNRLFAVVLLGCLSAQGQTITETFGSGANQFSIDFVETGNPNNLSRTVNTNSSTTLSGSFIPANPQEVGSVNYTYKIGKFEINRDIITKFNALQTIPISMGDLTHYGGYGDISKRPATRISWNQAARFVNWLNISQGYHAAYYFPTTGPNDNVAEWPLPPNQGYITIIGGPVDYSPGDYGKSTRFRHPEAYYFLPSVNEWYKAAYGSPDGGWYDYTNGSNIAPISSSGGLLGAVYGDYRIVGPADVDNAGELSAWGTMAQGGNAVELTESAIDGYFTNPNEFRAIMGGSWRGLEDSRSLYTSLQPSDYFDYAGFRVASVPEPSSLSLLLAGGAVLMVGMRRK